MKSNSIVTVLVLAFGIACAYGQTGGEFYSKVPFHRDSGPLSGEEWRLQLIERLMSLPSPSQSGAAQLHGMGDEAAVDILKILGKKPSLTAAEQQRTLDIVHMAFEQPASIINPGHQKPLATLFLMKHLGSTTEGGALKERIAAEVKFFEAAKLPAATQNPSTAK